VTARSAAAPGRRLAAVLATLVALASLPVAVLSRPVGADQVTSLQSQAAAVAQQLLRDQLSADAAQQLVSVSGARVAADEADLARTRRQVTADQEAIAAELRIVRRQAIATYTQEGTQTAGAAATLFGGDGGDVQEASEYASIAVGNISTSVDELHSAEQTLAAEQATLRQQEGHDQADLAVQEEALASATSTVAALRSEQAQVTGALASAIAAQTAARDAAARAAVARATPAAATGTPASTAGGGGGSTVAPTTVATGPGGGGAGGGSTGAGLSDPSLPPFLRCVVQAESGGNYQAISPNGLYRGAFQFSQATWNAAAEAAGLPQLVGVSPNEASRAAQDTLAVTLYDLDGEQPWLGDRCNP
jgi:hypothetical protein